MNLKKLNEEIHKLNEAYFDRNTYNLLLDQAINICKKAKKDLNKTENIDDTMLDVSYAAANLIKYAVQLTGSEYKDLGL